MEKINNSFCAVGEQPKPFPSLPRKVDGFFAELPFFQPWVWKLFAAVGAVGFMVGLGVGLWAYWPLAK